jgi:hypothetical protein
MKGVIMASTKSIGKIDESRNAGSRALLAIIVVLLAVLCIAANTSYAAAGERGNSGDNLTVYAKEENKPTAIIRPDIFPVHQDVDFEVIISPNKVLQKGDLIECQLANSLNVEKISPSFPKQWQFEDEEAKNYISVTTEGNGNATFSLEIKKREFVGGYSAQTRHGLCLNIILENGEVAGYEKIIVSYKNTTSPWRSIEHPGVGGHEGLVYIAINRQPIDDLPQYKVYSAEEKQFRVIVPSSVRPGEKFPVKMVSLDKYNNLSYATFENISIKCEDIILASGISFCRRGEAWVSLPEKGVFRLKANGVLSNPVKVTDQPNGPYWGDLHNHTAFSVDAVGNDPYGYARDVSCLDFASTTEHVAGGLPEYWEQTLKWVQEYYTPGEFVTLLALETTLEMPGPGPVPHYNMYLPIDSAPALYGTEEGLSSGTSLKNIFQYTKDYKTIGQTHHSGWGFDMRLKYPDELKLLEIYSMHGQSEYYDNDTPLSLEKQRHRKGAGKKGYYYARDAWALGKKWFTVGGSDIHFSQPGIRYNGLCAMYTNELSRNGVFDSLKKGTIYETTGERIILEFTINGKPMGTQIKWKPGEKLNFNISVNGTDRLQKVEVFGCPYIEGNQNVNVGEMMFSEDDPLVEEATKSWKTIFVKDEIYEMDYSENFKIPAPDKKMVYYVKVTQKNLIELPCKLEGRDFYQKRPVVAWSSPIWIINE